MFLRWHACRKGVAALALFAALLVGLLDVSPASGVTRYWKRGQPGAVTMPPMYGWYGGFTLHHTLRFSERTIGRSTAAPGRRQQICVQHKLYHFLPSYLGEPPQWAHAWSSVWICRFVGRGQQLNVAHLDFNPIPVKAYNAEVWVRWFVGQRQIGAARYTYNLTRDYQCQTFKCSTDYGYGGLAYIMFDY